MNDEATGWIFVAGQAVLFLAIVLTPSADHWPRPLALVTAASVILVAGIVVTAIAAFGLGDALTASPVPKQLAELKTDGLHRLVRHPVYTGVLLAIVGATLRSGNLVVVALAAASFAFLTVKAGWEESRLVERYPDYADYAARTPRFVPLLRRSSGVATAAD